MRSTKLTHFFFNLHKTALNLTKVTTMQHRRIAMHSAKRNFSPCPVFGAPGDAARCAVTDVVNTAFTTRFSSPDPHTLSISLHKAVSAASAVLHSSRPHARRLAQRVTWALLSIHYWDWNAHRGQLLGFSELMDLASKRELGSTEAYFTNQNEIQQSR